MSFFYKHNSNLDLISPLLFFIFILDLFFWIFFTSNIIVLLSIFSIILIFSIYTNKFKLIFITITYKFKFFLLIIFLTSILSGTINYILLLKLYILLLLAICFNIFSDLIFLLNYFDYRSNFIKPIYLRAIIRKILYSFLLGVRFVPEFFEIGNKLKTIKKLRGYRVEVGLVGKLKENVSLLYPMFILSFKKAVKVEKAYIIKNFSFDRKRSLYNKRKNGNDKIYAAIFLVINVIFIFV